jgi:O-antigen/teichoic acid export membrane protein
LHRWSTPAQVFIRPHHPDVERLGSDGFRARALGTLRGILGDPLYRGSLNLFLNTGVLGVLGLAFWALATRNYPASTVGVYTALTSGVGLLAAIATLGFQNTIMRHVASAENPRALVTTALAVIASVGAALCLFTVLVLGPHLPRELDIEQRGSMALLLTALVVVAAMGTVVNAGLVATRATRALLIANTTGGIVKIAAIAALTTFRSSGILLAFSLGLFAAYGVAGVTLFRRLDGTGLSRASFGILRRHLSLTAGNFVATTAGILPATVVPLEVLAIGGSVETAHFGIAFIVVGYLMVIPSTLSVVLFAEASRPGMSLEKQLRKALRGTYALLLPASVLFFAFGPLMLRVFGASYASAAAGCVRVLVLSVLPMGGTYLVDSLLLVRDRIGAYVFMNIANAALTLGGVALLLPHGLTAAAAGWALAQGLSLLLGLAVLAIGRSGRHRRTARQASP